MSTLEAKSNLSFGTVQVRLYGQTQIKRFDELSKQTENFNASSIRKNIPEPPEIFKEQDKISALAVIKNDNLLTEMKTYAALVKAGLGYNISFKPGYFNDMPAKSTEKEFIEAGANVFEKFNLSNEKNREI
ncbi:MAG TPA: hypothetical protein P5556_05830 [Candidatus Gastranaerophilales bacterium]|nr:hypothetical protein [Candidatus Gastranaerophilales bacterium]